MTIRLLSFPECPNAQPTLQLVEEVVSALGVQADIKSIHVFSAEETKINRFLGSPTIHVDGKDIERSRWSDGPNYGCRIYQKDGRQSGTPPRQMLIEAIERATNCDRSGLLGSSG